MAKKKKRRIQTPSLSPFDKGLYVLLDVLSVLLSAFGYAFVIGRYRRIVFQDPHVLAQESNSMVLMALGLVLGGFLLALFETMRQKKQPIFGKNGIAYGPPKWKPVYPFFSRAFWVYHRKKIFPVLAGVLALVMVLCIVTALALPLRTCLYDDGSIVSYNCRNETDVCHEAADITEFRLYTDTIRGKHSDRWTFGIQLTSDKESKFDFLYSEFRHNDRADIIRAMIQLKDLYSNASVCVQDADHLPDVVRDQNLTPEEEALLYELFRNPSKTR